MFVLGNRLRFVLIFVFVAVMLGFAAACSSGAGGSRSRFDAAFDAGPNAPVADRSWSSVDLGRGISLRYLGSPLLSVDVFETPGGATVSVASAGTQEIGELITELSYDPSRWEGRVARFAGAMSGADVSLTTNISGKIAAGAAWKGLVPVRTRDGELLLTFSLTAGPDRAVRQAGGHPPLGIVNKPKGLQLTFTPGPPKLFATWYQTNVGDYDQNGEVGVADITPIALYYGANTGTVLGVVDGDASGEVGVSDITPIAINYQAALMGYNIYVGYKGAGDPAFTYTLEGGTPTVARLDPTAQDRLVSYGYQVNLGSYGDYDIRVLPVGPADMEAAMDTVSSKQYSFQPPVPSYPANQHVTDTTRDHVTVAWDAVTDPLVNEILCWKGTVGGTNLADYTLDATLPATDTSHVFASLTAVTNYFFLITTKSAENIDSAVPTPLAAYTAVAPIASLTGPAQTLENYTAASARFDASASSDPDGNVVEYHWNWGDATPPDVFVSPTADHVWTSEGTFTVTLTVVDNDAAVSPPFTQDVQVIAGRTDVLVVYSTVFPRSDELANYYADLTTGRGIDPGNLYGVSWASDAGNDEEVSRTYYDTTIRPEIEDHLTTTGLKNQIKYIVLCKGIPLKIIAASGSDYNDLDYATVDNELCCIFDTNYAIAGRSINPIRAEVEPTYPPFQAFAFSYGDVTLAYLVSRLDAYTIDEAKGIVDRSKLAPGNTDGWVVLDDDPGKTYDMMHDPTWLGRPSATTVLNGFGANLFEDDTASFVNDAFIANPAKSGNVIGYCSHGIHQGSTPGDTYILDSLNYTYRPGAMFITYESFNGYSFVDGRRDGQGMIADFIRMGGTCGIGNVYEPWADACGDESVAYVRYLQGDNSVDALYRSLRYVSWVEVVIGDPLSKITP